MAKRFGFTLAEVLITLGIIGVIATMTIPVLMQNIQNRETVTKLQKALSIVQQTVISISNDYGGITHSPLSGQYGVSSDETAIENVFRNSGYFKYFKFSHWATGVYGSPMNTKYLSGFTFSTFSLIGSSGNPTFVLNDGSIIAFAPGQNCTGSYHGMPKVCSVATVDVNGIKLPNQYGRDIFELLITPTGVKPTGSNIDPASSDCNTGNNGFQCAGVVLSKGIIDY